MELGLAMILNQSKLRQQAKEWLDEDVGAGDITSYATIPEQAKGKGIIYSKANGIVAGIPVLTAIFAEADANIEVIPKVEDGDPLGKGSVIAELSGDLRSILTGERVALNILQRMSGIATKTNRLVQAAKEGNPNVRIVDTRKTLRVCA
jgi:nicotinate-nucleotide pyrophosphorylase (carboxylating)